MLSNLCSTSAMKPAPIFFVLIGAGFNSQINPVISQTLAVTLYGMTITLPFMPRLP